MPSPPATRTLRFCSNVAVCSARAVLRLPVAVQVRLAGSYSSALAERLRLLSFPPATRTMPFWSNVAVCTQRAVLRLPVRLQPTRQGVVRAGCVALQRIKPHRRIVSTSRETKERIVTLSGVLVWIASIPCWGHPSRLRRKRKAGEHQCDEHWQNCCVFGLSQRIHGSSFLFSPLR
jgi:hypothetical protein